MKAAVFAYHEIGWVCLEELLRAGFEIPCLFTHLGDPAEEKWFRTPALLAGDRHIPVYTPDDLKDPAWVSLLRGLAPDFLFSFYYRHLLPPEVLETAKIAALNLHGSLLPKFRGRCPINWVLIEGETRTGVTLHYMETKADAGDIVAQKAVPIIFEDTAHSLFLKMAEAARLLMREVLPELEKGVVTRTPQVGETSYYGGRAPKDGLIDWHKGANAIYNLVRAVTHPYPGAFTYVDGRQLFIWRAYPEEGASGGPAGAVISQNPLRIATGRGTLSVTSLQLGGEEEMSSSDFVCRHSLADKILGG